MTSEAFMTTVAQIRLFCVFAIVELAKP